VKFAKAGKICKGLTFHGLRHTAATKLADTGADDKTIAAITGHKSSDTQERRATSAARQRLIDTD